jgi:ferrochelatase
MAGRLDGHVGHRPSPEVGSIDMNKMVRPSDLDRAGAPRPGDHPPARSGRIGVLLMNLGTPEATDYWSMRRYLKEFLSDRRVIETAPLLGGRSERHHPDHPPGPRARLRPIWNRSGTRARSRPSPRANPKTPRAANCAGDRHGVDWACATARPPCRALSAAATGCDRILLVPLYPHTRPRPRPRPATSLSRPDGDALAAERARGAALSRRPGLYRRVAPPCGELARLDFEPEVILVSFHGVPKSYLLKGDPYYCQCHKTWRLLRDAFGWPEERFRLCFQSRFGNEEWLKPYTDETVKALADSGVKRMAIVAPGFSADCLETLEELNGENRHYFEERGGEQFAYLPCLNDTDHGMRVIRSVVERELQGWL